MIQKLLNDPVIQSCKISEATEAAYEAKQGLNYIKPVHGDDGRLADGGVAPEYRKEGEESEETPVVPEDIGNFYEQLDKDLDQKEDRKKTNVWQFEIEQDKVYSFLENYHEIKIIFIDRRRSKALYCIGISTLS